jgi:hypothetical protein
MFDFLRMGSRGAAGRIARRAAMQAYTFEPAETG